MVYNTGEDEGQFRREREKGQTKEKHIKGLEEKHSKIGRWKEDKMENKSKREQVCLKLSHKDNFVWEIWIYQIMMRSFISRTLVCPSL